MADNRKYYYLKLKEDFFDTDEMKILESMKDGYLYSNILLKLYLKSLSNSGRLMYRNVIPYTPEILAILTGHQVGTVEKSLDVFKKLDLIEMLDNGAIYMMDIQNFIGQSSSEADRQREYYNRMKAEKEALAGESTETPELPEPKEPVLPAEQKSNKAIGNYTTDFEELWEAYPRKVDKGQAYKKYKARLEDGFSHEQLYEAVKNYAAQCKKFENYYAQCKAIGLPVGAYYFGNAKSVAESEQEADHFLSVIVGKQFEYPIYYDVEGEMLNNSRDVLTDIVIAFCDRCEKAGYFVGVYTSDSHFQAHVDDDRLQRFTHWVAKYSSNEPVTGHDIWQYGGEYNYIADKTICGRTVDQDFCYRDFETEIKKAGLNGFSANAGDEAKEPEVSEPEGSTLDLLYRTMKDEFGGGDARKAALGSRYNEVQDAINHIDKASVQELVDEVWVGKYGDDEVRRTILGSRWQEVQDAINAGSKKYYTIKSGDTLSGIAAKHGTTVNAIAQLNGIENPNLIIAGDTIRVK